MSTSWSDESEGELDSQTLADPAEVPATPVTGDAGVDAAVATVAAAARGPLEDQVAAFDAAHRILQDRLADVDG